MKTITVSASHSYEVIVGSGILDQLGARVKSLTKAKKIAIISDSNVWPLFGDTAVHSLHNADFHDIVSFQFPAGEESKNGNTYLDILEFLAQNHLTRTDCVIALGGGVVGDMTGFVSATYLRGVDYIQVPTTLLAAVDSSVGGKTAIDLSTGKNLAGAFYQPRLVLCDIDTLNTLPQNVFRDGCAEVIKYGVLYDPHLFSHLVEKGLDFHREEVIARCVELKRDVVAQDEFDNGARQKLNLGHTIGHGVEAQSQFTVSHGQAVAIGMAVVCRASAAYGICDDKTCADVLEVLARFALPAHTTYSAESIYACALSDKKRSGGSVNLIVPQAIGDCIIRPMVLKELKAFIEAGM